MSYIGSTPTTQSFIAGTDYFSGNGSTTAFTLSRSVVSVNDIEVVINNVEQQPNTAYTVSGTTITFTSAPSAGSSNIYVRYLSTTTQSITPSQNTVSYSTWNSDLQNKTWGFKNRIINGAMVIDQRNAGASTTPTTSGYTLDRWRAGITVASKFSVQQNAGSVTPPAGFINYLGITSLSSYSVGSGDILSLQQHIEGLNVADLGWGSANAKTVTLSFWVYSSLTGSFGGALSNYDGTRSYPYSYTVSAANTWTQISVTIAGDQTGDWLKTNGLGIQCRWGLGVGSTYSGTAGSWSANNYFAPTGAVIVVGTNGATFYITGVQLEVGTQATNFDVRSYGTELQLCQRYYWKMKNPNDTYQTPISNGTVFGGGAPSSVYTCVPFPITMRAAPSIQYNAASDFAMFNNSTVYYATAVSTGQEVNTTNGELSITTSGMTTSQSCFVRVIAGANKFLAWTAEL